MRILYVSRVNEDDLTNSGVIKKCRAQVEAYRELGIPTDFIRLSQKGILKNDELVESSTWLQPDQKWKNYLFYFGSFLRKVARSIHPADYEIAHIRYTQSHPLFLYFLAFLKREHPAIQLVLEIPTWPYDLEPQALVHRLSLQLDRLLRNCLHQYVDRILHYGSQPILLNIPTLSIQNGISASSIPLARSVRHPNELHLIALGNWSHWHGLDRLIRGLGAYRQSHPKPAVQPILRVVGEGSALAGYQALVSELGIEAWVEFIPPTTATALDELFDWADLGIGSLGLFRIGLQEASPLKHREYAARGIPFLLSTPDPGFLAQLPFIHYQAPLESAIDLEKVFHFFENLQKAQPDYAQKLREYTLLHLSWKNQLAKVIDELN